MDQHDKINRYDRALNILEPILGPEGYPVDMIGKMALISTILIMEFPEWVFAGFYRVTKPNVLEIGPYQGAIIACGIIQFGRGVCGKAAQERQTVIVDDVSQFPGYISCDDKTHSEIVVPIIKKGEMVAVLDIDGASKGAFNGTDREYLERILEFL